MADRVLLVILRRDLEDLTPEEHEAILAAFPDQEVVFKRTDPRDYLEHAEQCREIQPTAVILPRERPIPSQAMDEGVRHITVLPGQGVVELEPLVPQFKPFQP